MPENEPWAFKQEDSARLACEACERHAPMFWTRIVILWVLYVLERILHRDNDKAYRDSGVELRTCKR